jgi:hypothetical protein
MTGEGLFAILCILLGCVLGSFVTVLVVWWKEEQL